MPESISDEMKIYEYSSEDFVSGRRFEDDRRESSKSKFERCLCDAWEAVEKTGVFWYSLDQVMRKRIPGRHNMMAQLNVKRFSQRRKPQEATAVLMPFDENKFHFNKIKHSEVLFELKRKGECESVDRIIINVSPIEYGHVLIVPQYKDCLPQVLDCHVIQVVTEICLLMSNRGFCIGFNSLCALASVNHLHLHAMFVDHCLPVFNVCVKRLSGNVSTLDDYMVNGFVLQLCDENTEKFARDVVQITSYLSTSNIAHNVSMCRRKRLETLNSEDGNTYVTVFIFPKKPSPGMKEVRFVNSCCFGLMGYLLLKDVGEFESITEATALGILQKYTYTSDAFKQLCDQLVSVIKTN